MFLKVKFQTLFFTFFYILIIVICFLWDYFDESFLIKFLDNKNFFLTDIFIGISLSSFFLFFGLILFKFFPQFEKMFYQIKKLLGQIEHHDIFLLSFSSAVAEEILFRGLLLNKTGVLISSLLFGFLHGFFQKRWLLWSIEATIIAFIFSIIVLFRNGAILCVIIAHFVYNFISFYSLKNLPYNSTSN